MAFQAFIAALVALATASPQDAFVAPGFNKIAWAQSPNFDQRPMGAVVDTVVLHHTASLSLESTVKWFSDPESRVSAHFTIGRDGSIVQHVSTFCRAWHAGESLDVEGRPSVNGFSIGIELVNSGDGTEAFTEEQIEVTGYLIGAMKHRFPSLRYVTSHEYIAVPKGRKNDPKGFPWERLRYLGLSLVYERPKPEAAPDVPEAVRLLFGGSRDHDSDLESSLRQILG